MLLTLLLACVDSADVDNPSADETVDTYDSCLLRFDYDLGESVLMGDFDTAGRTGWLEGSVEKGVVKGAWAEHGGPTGTLEGRLFDHPDYGVVLEGYGQAGDDRVAFYGYDQPGGASGWFAFKERGVAVTWQEGQLSGAIEGTFRGDGVVWGELDDGRSFEGNWEVEDELLTWSGDVLLEDHSDAWLAGEGVPEEEGWDSWAFVYPLWCAD